MSFSSQDYQALIDRLSQLADPAYKEFHQKLLPGVQLGYGVRMPALRALAKELLQDDPRGFLAQPAPSSYEEILLRGLVLAGLKLPLTEKLPLLSNYLPLIDNWAVCDGVCSSLKLKTPEDLEIMWQFLLPLFHDSREYFARFAVVMFLSHFVLPGYVEQGLKILEGLSQPEYYVQMAVAWAVCQCFVTYRELTLPLLQRKTLPPFTQNKAIQKIRESCRASREDKDLLRTYKVSPSL